MKCNKVKALTQDKAKVIEALKTSTKLELNKEKTMVSRKGSPPIPELVSGGKRREREEEKDNPLFISDNDLLAP